MQIQQRGECGCQCGPATGRERFQRAGVAGRVLYSVLFQQSQQLARDRFAGVDERDRGLAGAQRRFDLARVFRTQN